ncbi:endophilin B, putative [Pediculus humanus corporis]|uniref:Endophilin B, putative n=1 Tax=Pediculus humanus subsp. corporis TaxID=121224 RepID=E0VVJ4_PEDHC|nr:endophilin B, putative [Pediculus humanus corporis]EEB17400.1 endophilin B, putative [Pediculus humanus corporis]
MDFNVKKLVKDASTTFNRVVQLTEEVFGSSEKTKLDAHFEHLAERSNATNLWTSKIVGNLEAVLNPTVGKSVENFFMDKMEKSIKTNRFSDLEYLGISMIEAGNDFGPGTAYGSTLIKVGQCEQRLGQTKRDFIASAENCFINPLKKFLDGEMKTIQKERKILENLRLDLDSCKSKVRKARSLQNVQSAERDLRMAQSEFDRQFEITKLLLEGINSSHSNHLRCLQEFVESQVRYYEKCHQVMQDLQRDLTSLSLLNAGAPSFSALPCATENVTKTNPPRKALVKSNYNAKDSTELSLLEDEVIIVRELSDTDSDFFLGERGSQKGKVPKSILELF